MKTLLSLCLLCIAPLASAQEFSALVSPPRIEGAAQPGTIYRDVVEITNMSATTARYSLHTTDWELDQDAQAVFSEDLKPGSCRQWVAIERKEIQVGPGAKYRYRFEATVPADAPQGECRFALMIEGQPQEVAGGRVPSVSGRLGVIVYLSIGNAHADFKIVGAGRVKVEGVDRPALRIHNAGTAHDRLEGYVDAIDAAGNKITFNPSNLPILAGETRMVPLTPSPEKGRAEPKVVYPLTLKGKIDWAQSRLDVEGVSIP